jgi:ABC-type multidrug transport system ATPase subunit
MPPTSGRVQYSLNGAPLDHHAFYQNTAIAAPYMELVEEFTLWELVQFHFRLRTPRQGLSIDDILDKMYLQDARDKQILNFSSGMRQRLKLGLAFYTESSAIFLDEPGTNLDDKALGWYHENLASIATGLLVLIASNQREEYPENAKLVDMRDFG